MEGGAPQWAAGSIQLACAAAFRDFMLDRCWTAAQDRPDFCGAQQPAGDDGPLWPSVPLRRARPRHGRDRLGHLRANSHEAPATVLDASGEFAVRPLRLIHTAPAIFATGSEKIIENHRRRAFRSLTHKTRRAAISMVEAAFACPHMA